MAKDKEHPMSMEGYRSLFETLYPPLCLFANRYIHDMDMSKDIVQEVFIKIWNKKLPFKNHNASKGYLYISVKNQCLNYLKSKDYRSVINSSRMDLTELQSEEYVTTEILTVETYAYLYQAIKTLPPGAAKIILLTLNEYSTNDITEELELTASTVRTQKSIAYQKLKLLLNNMHQIVLIF